MVGLAAASIGVRADVVEKRSGGSLEGDLVSVDTSYVLIRVAGEIVRLPRSQVSAIRLGGDQTVVPPLKVEIRNVRSDDSIDVLLDDEIVLRDAREGGDWIDLTPKLKSGNNPIRLRIRNDRGTWAYRLSLRINGAVTPLACGTPQKREDPCRCCGKTGLEQGIVDDLPVVWLNVDRALGRAEVMP